MKLFKKWQVILNLGSSFKKCSKTKYNQFWVRGAKFFYLVRFSYLNGSPIYSLHNFGMKNFNFDQFLGYHFNFAEIKICIILILKDSLYLGHCTIFFKLCANNLWNFPSKLWNLFSTVLSRWVHPKNSQSTLQSFA